MGSARVRSTVAMVATHCVGDHSSHTRDCLSRSDCGLLRKIPRRLRHTRTGHAAQNSWLLLAGWIHYLAFDLFLGAWQARQAQRLGISHFLVVPCLLLTFLFGPIGLPVFWAIRSVVTKQLFLDMDRGYRQASVH
jgi:hypothetical protein